MGVAPERRRAPRLTITEILDLMQREADLEFQGNLQDNALQVFNKLNMGDKRTFLRKSLMVLWEEQIKLAESGMQDIVVDQEIKINPVTVEMERLSIMADDRQAQQRLKVWMYQALFVLGVAGVMLVVLITLLFGADFGEQGLMSSIKDVWQLFRGG